MGTTLLASKPRPRLTAMHLAVIMGVTRAAIYANPKLRAIAKEGKRGMEWEVEDIEALVGAENMPDLDGPQWQRRWVKTSTMCFLLDCSEEYLRNTNAPRHYLEGNGDEGIRPVRWDPEEVFYYMDTHTPS